MANYRPNNFKDILKNYNAIYPNSRSKIGKYSPELIKRSHELVNKIKFN